MLESGGSGISGGGALAISGGCSDSVGGPTSQTAVDVRSVCVEEVLYRQALSMGREAAVDELLGQYEASATLYVRAKLTLEQLALEPSVGEEDRRVLQKYCAGFAWRLAALRNKQSAPSILSQPENSLNQTAPEVSTSTGSHGDNKASEGAGAPVAMAMTTPPSLQPSQIRQQATQPLAAPPPAATAAPGTVPAGEQNGQQGTPWSPMLTSEATSAQDAASPVLSNPMFVPLD